MRKLLIVLFSLMLCCMVGLALAANEGTAAKDADAAVSASPTQALSPTPSAEPSSAPEPTPTAETTATPEPTEEPTPEPTATPTPMPTPTAVPGLTARQLPIDRSPGAEPIKENFKGQWTYEDSSIRVSVEKTTAYESTCFVAKISIGDPSQLRTETAAQSWKYRRTAPGEKIAERMRAVIAINGDYYSFIGGGYMIRQGELFRERPDPRRDILLIDDKGDFHIVEYSEEQKIAPFRDMKIINSFNFGPGLIINGEKGTNLGEYNNGSTKLRQRVAIGQAGHLTYYLFVTEARSDGSRGMTLKEFQDFVSQYPVINCYNLDGGNSANLVVNNSRINAVGFRDNREINDIIYFASTEGL